MPATEERTNVFPLVAFPRCLPETRVRGSEFENQACIGASAWLSSTARWGCGYRCDRTASGALDQRFYASSYGRFLSVDPTWGSVALGSPGSWNRFSYTWGDPVNGNDPTGLILDEEDGGDDGGGDDGGGDDGSGDDGGGSNTCVLTGEGIYSCDQTFTATGTGSAGNSDPNSGGTGAAPTDPDPTSPVPGGQTPPSQPVSPPSGPGKGGRLPLDPSSSECQAIAKKISNILRDIEEQSNLIGVNPGGLVGPGNTVGSHIWQLEENQANLAKQLALYASKCGGGPPPAVPVRPPVLVPPGTKWPSAPLLPKPSPIGIGIGVGGLGACFASGWCWLPIIAIP